MMKLAWWPSRTDITLPPGQIPPIVAGIAAEAIDDRRRLQPIRLPEFRLTPNGVRAPAAHLLCLDGSSSEVVQAPIEPLADGADVTVGRGEHCVLRLRPRQVSRYHARLFAGDGGWAVEDLDSTNGVFVNGRRLTAAWLKDGDEISFGPVAFRYSLDASGQAAVPDASALRTALDWRRHAPTTRSRPGVLVIGPEPERRAAVIAAGLQTGHNLLVVSRQGFAELLPGFDPDVILVDLSGPDTGEHDALLRAIADRARDVPILPVLGPEADPAAFRQVADGLRLSLVEPFCRAMDADTLADALKGVPDAARPLRRHDLAEAARRRDFRMYFQPKVDIATGRVIGAEALMRWHHPKRGVIQPDRFISLAERTGEITPLTVLALEQVAECLHAVGSHGPDLTVAVNISAKSLAEPGFAGRVVGLMQDAGIAAERVILEITETMAMSGPALYREVLDGLRREGFGLSLDDFGTGYSSLEELHRMPFTELKIDKQFVLELLNDRNAEAITRSTITLARELGLKTVAEGVETAEILDRLRVLGCDVAQGYLIGRPMVLADFVAWLSRRAT